MYLSQQDEFIRFLSTGKVEDERIDLLTISDEQFQRLEAIVDVFFHDGWEKSTWTVFASERFRRFGRLG